jgi:hypothetical protein
MTHAAHWPRTASHRVVLLYMFSHFQQKATGNPAPPPFLGYLNGRIHKNQGADVPHDQTLVG